MNREHIYRAKRTDNGEWVEGFYAYVESDKRHVILTQDDDGGLLYFTVDPATVGECIGKRDKNEQFTHENSTLRNELCERCGRYKEAHNGACDGCRWQRKGE